MTASAAPAQRLSVSPDDVQAADRASGDEEELYLEVTVNRAPTGRLVRFVRYGSTLSVSAATLGELGIRWPGGETPGGLIALDSLPGLRFDYDASLQRVNLTVPVAWLTGPTTRLGFTQPESTGIDPATRAPGLLFNYDVSAQGSQAAQSVSAWTEQRVFGVGPGIWNNSLVTRAGARSSAGTRQDTVRLDTSWQLDFPGQMVTVMAGDTITSSLSWTRAARVGGVRVSRNFALQPYRVTVPLASFTGEAVLPSTVELYINGARQAGEGQVQPGRFQLDALPSFQGLGQAQMVITDINGMSRVVEFSLYNTPQLLEKGLADWSAELGAIRRDYGLQSFAYDSTPLASASGRYGLRDHTTIEAHVEAADGLQLGGTGGVWLLGRRGGVINAAIATSRHDAGPGVQGSAGYQWQTRAFNVSLGTQVRSAEFADAGTLAGSPPPLRTDRAFVGMSLPIGRIGAGLVSQEQVGSGRSRFLNVNWSLSSVRNGYLNFNLNRNLDGDGGNSAILYWSLPINRRLTTAASLRRNDRATGTVLEATRSVDADRGGWGWRAQVAPQTNGNAQAEVTQLGRYGQWTTGVSWQDGSDDRAGAYANASGSLLSIRRYARATRRVDDAFALVSTGGIPDIAVKLENRVVGHTDEHGLLLVNRLQAWQRNRLSIDPMQLPEDTLVDRVELEAVPASRSGMVAAFDVRQTLSVQVVLRDAAGDPLPIGSAIRLASSPTGSTPTGEPISVVGYDGLVFLQNPPAGARLLVGDGDRICSATLPGTLPKRGLADLGELTCR